MGKESRRRAERRKSFTIDGSDRDREPAVKSSSTFDGIEHNMQQTLREIVDVVLGLDPQQDHQTNETLKVFARLIREGDKRPGGGEREALPIAQLISLLQMLQTQASVQAMHQIIRDREAEERREV